MLAEDSNQSTLLVKLFWFCDEKLTFNTLIDWLHLDTSPALTITIKLWHFLASFKITILWFGHIFYDVMIWLWIIYSFVFCTSHLLGGSMLIALLLFCAYVMNTTMIGSALLFSSFHCHFLGFGKWRFETGEDQFCLPDCASGSHGAAGQQYQKVDLWSEATFRSGR